MTSTLFLYWYINLNKNLNGISFSLYFRKVTFLRRFIVRAELLTLHVYLFVPECTRISECFVIFQLSLSRNFTDF
jgi:hypothetical protein